METKNCQNCKQDFIIESDDFSFYQKINVPVPTFCSECRMKRRMLFRNERTLHKRDCDLCKKSVISMYSQGSTYVVYCNDCFNSEKWDPNTFGVDYDFNTSFFEQVNNLFHRTPRRALYQDFAVNSEYSNFAVHLKNCYLCFGGHSNEDSSYCAQGFYLKSCLDVDFCSNCEFCFDSLHIRKCFRVRYGYYSEDCLDSWFIYDCRSCSNCVGCTNLRNQSYCIWNVQYSKEEYFEKLKEMNLSNPNNLESAKSKFWEHSLNFPRKYANVKNAVKSFGDNLEQVKDCRYSFSATEADNVSYSFFVPTGAKDCFDIDHVGLGTSECYELHSGFGNNRVFFSNRTYYSQNIEYSDDCYNSEYLFACSSLRKKSYCILNKQYTKEEYNTLLPKVKEHMNALPYKDKKGRVYKYGEFFPIDIMPFGYNESVVSEYFPLTKNEIIELGYIYKVPEIKNYKPTLSPKQLPLIEEVNEKILQEIIQCSHCGNCNDKCTTAFRLIKNELDICKTLNVPLPVLCPNCRHMERMKLLNQPKVYDRKCMKENCFNEFKTPYPSTRSEIIYCEKCYQQEVY